MTNAAVRDAMEAAATTAGVGTYIFGHIWEFNNRRFPTYPALLVQRWERSLNLRSYDVVEIPEFTFFVFVEYNPNSENIKEAAQGATGTGAEGMDWPVKVTTEDGAYDRCDYYAKLFIAALEDSGFTVTNARADDGDWKSVNNDIGTRYSCNLKIHC